MIPVSSIADVAEGLATAQHLYKIGFMKAKNTSQKYRKFGEDIKSLAINLDLLYYVIQRAQYQAESFDSASRYLGPADGAGPAAQQILGNFRATLNECDRLLNNQEFFQKSDSFVSNIYLYYQIDPDIQQLRERIAFHNIKLSIFLKILDFQILEDRFVQIFDATATILSAVEQLGQQVRGEEEGADLPNGLPGSVIIPRELEDGFIALSQKIYPDLSTIPLDRGIDAAVFYFNNVTKTPKQQQQSEIRYLVAIIDIMKAAWMLYTVRTSHEYRFAASNYSLNEFEKTLGRWGMTIERFLDKFEEELCKAFGRLLGHHLLLPPTPDLLEIFEKDKQIWPGDSENIPETETQPIELGVKIISAQLRCLDAGYTQTMQVYHQKEKRFNLVLMKTCTSEGREKETIDGYDLEHVQIIPSYAKQTRMSPSVDPQTILFKVDRISPVSRVLAFHQSKDLFEFQQTITGYKVIHDDNRVLTTSQESKLLGGTRREDLCRLQIWLAPPPKVDVEGNTKTPYLVTTAIDSRKSSQNSLTSSTSPSSSVLGSQPRKNSSASTISKFSSAMRSSSSSRTSVVIDPPSLPDFDVSVGAANIRSAIYTAPVAPCIVLFAHKIPASPSEITEEETSRSYLIIEITQEVTIEHELNESEDVRGASYRCVLEWKGNYLPARRSPETSDACLWDLAVAGLHKRQVGTEAVKKLKHVIIQFYTQDKLSQFMTKFQQAKALAKLRLSQFMRASR